MSVFTVEPTEMAGVRRFGTVTTEVPFGTGIHVKLLLIDQVDRLQVSLDVLGVEDLTVYTIDNQNPNIINLITADKWNGVTPQSVLNNQGIIPFFELNRTRKPD